MKIKQTEVSKLTEDSDNVRAHTERNIDAIKKSLQRFGQQKPIVVDTSGRVIAGNGTLRAAEELGWNKIDTVETHLTDDDATAFAIADNRTAELAAWKEEELAKTLGSFEDELIDAAGFTGDEMIGLLADMDGSPGESENLIANPNSSYGLGTYSGVMKQIVLSFQYKEYSNLVEALIDLRKKYAVETFSEAIVVLLEKDGYEIN